MPTKRIRNGVQWDQINKGAWVVVLRDYDNDEEDDETETEQPKMVWGLFGPEPRSKSKPMSYDGYPWKVMEMSYPFLLVTDGKQRCSIDFRRFDLQIVSTAYATVTHETKVADWKKVIASKKEQKKLDQIQKDQDTQTCKRCGALMMSQRLIKPGSGEWVYICPYCDIDSRGERIKR